MIVCLKNALLLVSPSQLNHTTQKGFPVTLCLIFALNRRLHRRRQNRCLNLNRRCSLYKCLPLFAYVFMAEDDREIGVLKWRLPPLFYQKNSLKYIFFTLNYCVTCTLSWSYLHSFCSSP
jgi:hypothetical protein